MLATIKQAGYNQTRALISNKLARIEQTAIKQGRKIQTSSLESNKLTTIQMPATLKQPS